MLNLVRRIFAIFAIVLLAGCGQSSPSREHINSVLDEWRESIHQGCGSKDDSGLDNGRQYWLCSGKEGPNNNFYRIRIYAEPSSDEAIERILLDYNANKMLAPVYLTKLLFRLAGENSDTRLEKLYKCAQSEARQLPNSVCPDGLNGNTQFNASVDRSKWRGGYTQIKLQF